MPTAIYLRKSRAEETSATIEDTLRIHKSTLLAYAKQHDIEVSKLYEEVVSGESLLARPQMLQLLEDVENGLYEAVLCMDIDRLGRGGMKDQGIILDTFKYSDTKIITPEKIYNLNDDMDEELTEFKTFMSRRELKIINKRLKRGLKNTIENGGYVANAPYGYVKIYRDKKPTLEINESEAEFVRMIFDWYVNERIGTTTIANRLNSLGAKPHRGNSFGRTSVMHILKNPTFAGKIVWDKKTHIRKGSRGNDKSITIYNPREEWSIFEGLHEPIISEEIFNKTQEILSNKYIPSSNTGEIKNPFAGLIKCGVCGRNLQRARHKDVDYILCNTKSCVAATQFKFLEQSIIDTLHDYVNSFDVDIQKATERDIEKIAKKITATENQLKTLINQKNKLFDFLENGTYTESDFKERMGILSDKLDITSSELQKLTIELSRARNEDRIALINKIKSVLEHYTRATVSDKNIMLKGLLRGIVYKKEKKSKPNDFELEFILRSF